LGTAEIFRLVLVVVVVVLCWAGRGQKLAPGEAGEAARPEEEEEEEDEEEDDVVMADREEEPPFRPNGIPLSLSLSLSLSLLAPLMFIYFWLIDYLFGGFLRK